MEPEKYQPLFAAKRDKSGVLHLLPAEPVAPHLFNLFLMLAVLYRLPGDKMPPGFKESLYSRVSYKSALGEIEKDWQETRQALTGERAKLIECWLQTFRQNEFKNIPLPEGQAISMLQVSADARQMIASMVEFPSQPEKTPLTAEQQFAYFHLAVLAELQICLIEALG